MAPHRTARTVGHDQPVGVDRVVAVSGLDLELRAVWLRRHAQHLVAPAQVQPRQGHRAFDQVLLEVVLLQVDHRRAPMAGLWQQVEVKHLVVAEKRAADVPGHALVDQCLAAAQPVQDLERALGVAQAARAQADGVVVVEQQHRQALLGQVYRRRQPDRACPYHHHRVALDASGGVEFGRSAVRVARVGVGAQHGRGVKRSLL